ncbi:ATP-binding protein [Ruminiclostridium cellulolyticum]|uniref:Putative anti-sigma regulatory factor, serine/threonine protein kinase n=1 Tax=Ruminiclostridium cellulolyticum (strain ATCC 35319 / DSM 5812 / JCM 6584 / H10) TaxID=394503 RepID=B8I5W7_RUMCH|nr:ATP-binding protein [Ruminiclostridium cellulolyticum]ACL74784.1 putative anti-sigma regulatory factor, serine/threonine protein kinase [Ruminiclostridium cellulolyticum H10]
MESIINDNVTLILPAKSEYVSTARLTASSVATRVGFNIDEVEDIKVSVSEVCNIILSRTDKKISQYRISFDIIANNLKITFMAENSTLDCFEESIENEYGLYIMKALMDSVELCNDDHSIVMTKKIGV